MPVLATANYSSLRLMDRPDLALTLTKINLWRLTQFRKCVYLDADVLALRAPDELFNLDVDFAVSFHFGPRLTLGCSRYWVARYFQFRKGTNVGLTEIRAFSSSDLI